MTGDGSLQIGRFEQWRFKLLDTPGPSNVVAVFEMQTHSNVRIEHLTR